MDTKTPNYTRKAIDSYRNKFDFVQVRFPKGTKERIEKLVGGEKNLNDYIVPLILADLERMEESAPESAQEAGTVNNAIEPEKPAEKPRKKPKRETSAPEEGKTNAERLAEIQALIDAKKTEQDRKAEELKQQKAEREKQERAEMVNQFLEHLKNGAEPQEDPDKAAARDESITRANLNYY